MLITISLAYSVFESVQSFESEFSLSHRLLFPTFSLLFYTIIYEKYRLLDLPCNCWTWFLAMILIDFGFYWFHRACHGMHYEQLIDRRSFSELSFSQLEINFFWATHQVHHSSEHFNLTTALRQAVPQLYFHTVSHTCLH